MNIGETHLSNPQKLLLLTHSLTHTHGLLTTTHEVESQI